MTDPIASPPGTTAAAGSELDRVQAELQALLQEARQTQVAIEKLQATELGLPAADRLFFTASDIRLEPTAQLVGAALVLATAAVAWWVWRIYLAGRKAAHAGQRADAHVRIEPDDVPKARPAPAPQPQAVVATAESVETLDSEFSESAFFAFAALADAPAAPTTTPGRFDSEAAASEVMRVRKSLSDKRHARAILGQRDDTTGGAAQPVVTVPVAALGFHHPDIDLDFIAQEPQPEITATYTAPYTPEPAVDISDPYPLEDASPSDDSVKLELAQEALLLDLLPQARELALEVLEGGDASWAPEAEAMISRLDQLEYDTEQARLNWR